jgi:hypothetical protein
VGDGHPTIRQAERAAFSRLRRGDVAGALVAVERVPADRRSPGLRLIRAEARVCFGQGDLDEIEHLRDLAADAGDDAFALRVEATLADHHATRGNSVCGMLAADALARVADEPTVATERLWARGRLWRTLAGSALFVPHDRPTASLRMLDRAKADFSRAGFDAESARSAADVHFVWLLVFTEAFEQARATVSECLARVRQLGSSYAGLLLAYRAYLEAFAGELAAAHATMAEIDRLATTGPLHPLARVIVGYLRVGSRLVAEGPTPEVLGAIEDHLTVVRREAMLVTAGQLVGLASLLIDAGYVCAHPLAVARRWAHQASAGESSTPRTSEDLAGLLARLDLLERGDDAAVAAVDADLVATRGLGLRREAAHRALRAALAAQRAGRHAVAERFRREGLTDLGAAEQPTLWEQAMAHMAAAAPAPGCTRPRVRLLGPEVEVEVDERVQAVSAASARLLVALVSDGGATPADRLIDLLWPDADPDAGRARLRVALHRLRRALRPAAGGRTGRTTGDDPVSRRGDLVALSPSVDVDVVEFEALASGDRADRGRALALYRGDVAHAQLAYDDVAEPLRRRQAAVWRRLARETLADLRLAHEHAWRIAAIASAGGTADGELAALADAAEAHLAAVT